MTMHVDARHSYIIRGIGEARDVLLQPGPGPALEILVSWTKQCFGALYPTHQVKVKFSFLVRLNKNIMYYIMTLLHNHKIIILK